MNAMIENNMNSNGFIRKKVDTLTLGETVKKLRLEMHFSLGDVSKSTRIQIKYLEALESGTYNRLPADVYVRGFLRTLAQFMGVNDKTLIKLYEREKGIQENINPDSKKSAVINPIVISKFVVTPKMIIIAASLLVAIGAFAYVYRELNDFVSMPRLVITDPINGKTVSDRSIDFVGKTDPGSSVEINDQKVLVDENGDFREKIDLQPGMNNISVVAKNKFDKETSEKITIKADFQDAVDVNVSTDQLLAGKKDEQKLKLEIWTESIATWISVEADGNLVYSGTPANGLHQNFEANNKLVVSSDHGNSTKIKLNENDLGSLGTDEKPVRGKVFESK